MFLGTLCVMTLLGSGDSGYIQSGMEMLGKLTDFNHFASFTTINSLVRLMTSNVPEDHKQPGEMSVPL